MNTHYVFKTKRINKFLFKMTQELYSVYIIIVLVVIAYQLKLYFTHKTSILKIEHGKALFMINSVMILYLVSIVIFNIINLITLIGLFPFLMISIWFNFKLMRTKSPSEIIYTTIFIVMCLLVFYHLFW